MIRLPGARALATASCLAVVLAAPAAAQQPWPARAIRLISPGGPGSSSDVLARVIFERVGQSLGVPFVVEYKPGAGTTLAAEYVARQTPADGYTYMLASTASFGIAPGLYPNLKYDTVKDFAGVARLVTTPSVLYVGRDFPAKSVRELVDYARANPGKVNYGSAGSGTTLHLTSAWFQKLARVDIVHVPYKAVNTQVLQAILAGDVHFAIDSIVVVMGAIRDGRVRPLAVTPATRTAQLPDVPTMIEAGVPGYDLTTWFGLTTRAGTPPAILERLANEIRRALADPEVVRGAERLGADPAFLGPPAFEAFYRDEIAKWGNVVKESGAKVE